MNTRIPIAKNRPDSRQRGTAIIVVITLISMLLIYSLGNIRTLDHLGKELRLLQQKQLRHHPTEIPRNAE